MYVKKFEGETLDEALKAVKVDLGPDAIILKTVTNKGLKGAFKKSRIEITAAISEQNYAKKSKVDHVLTHDQKEEFYQAPASRINNMINEYDNHSGAPAERKGGYGAMGLNKVVNTVSNKIKDSLDDFLQIDEEPTPQKGSKSASLDQFMQAQPPKRQQEVIEEENHFEQGSDFQVENDYETQRLIQSAQKQNNEVSSELRHQIKSQKHQIEILEQKLFELSERLNEKRVEDNEPKGLIHLRNSLRSLDLSEKIIQKVVKKALFEISKEDLEDLDLVNDFALRELNSIVRTEMPLFSKVDMSEAPVTTVLISETSSGQSSMALKLAVLKENVKVIRFRESDIDAVNSDFTAQIFKIDITTVSTLSHLMSEARRAIADGKSLILDLKLMFKEVNESKKFLETLKRSFDHIDFYANISAINSEVYNRKILSKYKAFINGVTISYIDQCLSFGKILNVHEEHNEIPLIFFSTGATVPDDIEAATAERILAGMFQF